MKLSAAAIAVVLTWLPAVLGQIIPACPAELASTDDCADVINPNACYNEYGFRGAQTLACIEGKDNADRARKASCCSL
ncbi:hypothetical protein SPI_02548 [Niveomyces insectorum RCEF 264]|uniref:Uncharacterized protein n=1 Tax=Niveomyces insectorum RCEF 264 TaxID=1081102 RepID=A0A167Y2S1_9HYPO|nr:hypothetical protein SPI_02548 [Niveomyces insectorum RCEF 264]